MTLLYDATPEAGVFRSVETAALDDGSVEGQLDVGVIMQMAEMAWHEGRDGGYGDCAADARHAGDAQGGA